MAVRKVTRLTIGTGATAVTFAEGALEAATFEILGNLIATSDGSIVPLTDSNYSLKTVTGFTVTVDVAGSFWAVCYSTGTAVDDPDLEPNAIVSLAQVKAYLGIPSSDTTHDAFLKSKINVVSDWIEEETNSNIVVQNHSEIVNGEGYTDYDMPHKPVLRLGIESGMGSPLVSCSFTSALTSDGLGHSQTEFVGTGGSGVAGVDSMIEPWGVVGGKALCSADALSVCYWELGESDVIVEAALYWTADNVGLLLRYTSVNEYIIAYHDGTNIKVDKKTAATVTTNLLSEVVTYVSGAKLKVVLDGVKIRVYYNGTQVGSEVYCHNFTASTKHGLYSTGASEALDNFVVYSLLDAVQYRDDTDEAWQQLETSWKNFSTDKCFVSADEAFPRGKSNVLIHWQAGYDPVPKKIEQIAIEAVAQIFKESSNGGDLLLSGSKSFSQTGGSISQSSGGNTVGLSERHKKELLAFTFGEIGERL